MSANDSTKSTKLRLNLVGYRSGKLTAIAFAGVDRNGNSKWLCRCECGVEKVHTGCNLKRQSLKSCGCSRYDHLRVDSLVEDHPDFPVFIGMKDRCFNKSCREYPRYGGRGITVCDDWVKGGFRKFISDMGSRPTPKHSIDRINNDGNYEPSNCRWATSYEQANNRRSNVFIEWDGLRLTKRQWADRLGIPYPAFKRRFEKKWTLEKTMTYKYKPMSSSN